MPGRSGIVPAGRASQEPYRTAWASAATARSGVRKDGTDPRAALPSAAGTTSCSTSPSTARKVVSTGTVAWLTADRSAAACARPGVATIGTYTTTQRVDVRAGHRGPHGRGQIVRAHVHAQVQRPAVGDPQAGVQAGVDRQHAQRAGVADDRDPVTDGHRLGGQQLGDIEGRGRGCRS